MKRIHLFGAVLVLLVLVASVGRAFGEFPWSVQTDPFTEAIDGVLANATDASVQVVKSYPLAQNQGIFYDVTAGAIAPGFTGGAGGNVKGFCGRSAGNVACVSGAGTLLFSTFAAPQPTVAVVANTTTQSMDVVVAGKVGQPLGFWISIGLKRTN